MWRNIKDHAFIRGIIFAILFIAIHYFIARNIWLMSRDLLNGDFSGKAVHPAPQEGFFRIPNGKYVKPNRALDRLAADFAQVYFPSRMFEELEKSYTDGAFDPWDRASRYAPFVHYLCALSYCRLKYGPASLAHVYLQLLLFYISFIAAFIILKIPRYLPFGILFINVCLFLTPVGLSWFERGQFSLYVAMAYLFVTLGILKRNRIFFLLGGFFAFIKWTTFPVLFILLSVFIFASGSYKKIKANLLLALPLAAVIVLLLAWFPKEGYSFVIGLYNQETLADGVGISLVRVLPVAWVKFMPLGLIIIGILHVRQYRDAIEGMLPFVGGACILMVMYPTISFEYNLLGVFFFIPIVIHWSEWAKEAGWTRANLFSYGFFLYLIVASWSGLLLTATGNEYLIYGVYGAMAASLLLVPLLLPQFGERKLQPLKSTP